MSFECGSVTPSRVKLARCKCRVSSERAVLQKEIRERNRSIRDREFVSFLSSFKVQASKRLAYDMDEQWPHHCSSDRVPLSSAQPSSYKSDMMKQVQGHQPHLPLDLENNVNPTGLSEKEIERRRKIGAANKGKAPWTKGRKLSKEHKQLIKQRTIEALRDPKVKKKMIGRRQLHRQVSKEKISAALRKIWERRIVSVKSRQTVLQIWSNSIARAAKEGGHCQGKLDWDSYGKIKSQMISMFLWNKEKERIIKKLKRTVTKIVAKKLQAAERMELQTRRARKLKPEKLVLQKSDAQPRRVVASTRPKLKERLTKWHGRKKELEIVISLRTRKGGAVRKPPVIRRRRAVVERRAEVDLVMEPGVPSGQLKELHLPCKDGLPSADT
ncbi:uncharacterized protein LOC100825588 isoform X2 [Brachypodium distachyon]|nr:uncharacterized protein LOC100825588 isoform X2 [Brachypodium distachyon]|eukprot:XP_014753774.1 uncharacterized protein LOC100825588 isoform X2 [Brachypodium distachyon]